MLEEAILPAIFKRTTSVVEATERRSETRGEQKKSCNGSMDTEETNFCLVADIVVLIV